MTSNSHLHQEKLIATLQHLILRYYNFTRNSMSIFFLVKRTCFILPMNFSKNMKNWDIVSNGNSPKIHMLYLKYLNPCKVPSDAEYICIYPKEHWRTMYVQKKKLEPGFLMQVLHLKSAFYMDTYKQPWTWHWEVNIKVTLFFLSFYYSLIYLWMHLG